MSKYSSFIFIAGAVAFGVFLVWNIANSNFASLILNRTEKLTVTGTNSSSGTGPSRELNLVTILPFDGIRSIENPVFFDRERADQFYKPDELVLGIEINGDVRAYSVPLLSRHEIVNDVVGGKPVAITW